MSLIELADAARIEEVEVNESDTHDVLMRRILAHRIPGAALVLGEPSLAIHLPRAKKDAA
jgi:hypothetical protein